MKQFYLDAAAGSLANFTFLEPRITANANASSDPTYGLPNHQHPQASVMEVRACVVHIFAARDDDRWSTPAACLVASPSAAARRSSWCAAQSINQSINHAGPIAAKQSVAQRNDCRRCSDMPLLVVRNRNWYTSNPLDAGRAMDEERVRSPAQRATVESDAFDHHLRRTRRCAS